MDEISKNYKPSMNKKSTDIQSGHEYITFNRNNYNESSYSDMNINSYNDDRITMKEHIMYIDDSKYFKFIGLILNKLSPYMKYISTLFKVVLINVLIVSILLIVSRIFNNKLFPNQIHTIFVSDSEPLLLLASVTMMFSYGLTDIFRLRIFLSLGCALFCGWAITNKPTILLDTFIFNLMMLLLNIKHTIQILYDRRYIKFDKEYEQIYQKIFSNYLSRVDFEKLIKISFKRDMKNGDIFKQKYDEVTSLCVLVKGCIEVCKQEIPKIISNDKINLYDDHELVLADENFVNMVKKNEFIEGLCVFIHIFIIEYVFSEEI